MASSVGVVGIALKPKAAECLFARLMSHLGMLYGKETARVFCLGRFLAEQAPRILDSPSKQTASCSDGGGPPLLACHDPLWGHTALLWDKQTCV